METIMSGFKVLRKNCHLAERSVMFVSLIRTGEGRPGVLHRLKTRRDKALWALRRPRSLQKAHESFLNAVIVGTKDGLFTLISCKPS